MSDASLKKQLGPMSRRQMLGTTALLGGLNEIECWRKFFY
jgi:hypothetical protein